MQKRLPLIRNEVHCSAATDVQVVTSLRKRHKNGKVNREDFTDVVKRATGKLGNGESLNEEKVDLLYRVLDTDKDGLLDVQELERHYSGMFNDGHGQLL
jgi:Ca2+-binding EF-hand superfamily protein